MGNSSKRDARALTARSRRIQVVELRCKLGLTLQEIADRIGVHKSRVGAILDEVKAEMSAEAGETYRAWVMHGAAKDEARRLRMWNRIEERVEAGDLEAIAVGVKLIEKGEQLRAGVRRMMGIDAPQRAELTGKDGAPLEHKVEYDAVLSSLARIAASGGAGAAHPQPDAGGGAPPQALVALLGAAGAD